MWVKKNSNGKVHEVKDSSYIQKAINAGKLGPDDLFARSVDGPWKRLDNLERLDFSAHADYGEYWGGAKKNRKKDKLPASDDTGAPATSRVVPMVCGLIVAVAVVIGATVVFISEANLRQQLLEADLAEQLQQASELSETAGIHINDGQYVMAQHCCEQILEIPAFTAPVDPSIDDIRILTTHRLEVLKAINEANSAARLIRKLSDDKLLVLYHHASRFSWDEFTDNGNLNVALSAALFPHVGPELNRRILLSTDNFKKLASELEKTIDLFTQKERSVVEETNRNETHQRIAVRWMERFIEEIPKYADKMFLERQLVFGSLNTGEPAFDFDRLAFGERLPSNRQFRITLEFDSVEFNVRKIDENISVTTTYACVINFQYRVIHHRSKSEHEFEHLERFPEPDLRIKRVVYAWRTTKWVLIPSAVLDSEFQVVFDNGDIAEDKDAEAISDFLDANSVFPWPARI